MSFLDFGCGFKFNCHQTVDDPTVIRPNRSNFKRGIDLVATGKHYPKSFSSALIHRHFFCVLRDFHGFIVIPICLQPQPISKFCRGTSNSWNLENGFLQKSRKHCKRYVFWQRSSNVYIVVYMGNISWLPIGFLNLVTLIPTSHGSVWKKC